MAEVKDKTLTEAQKKLQETLERSAEIFKNTTSVVSVSDSRAMLAENISRAQQLSSTKKDNAKISKVEEKYAKYLSDPNVKQIHEDKNGKIFGIELNSGETLSTNAYRQKLASRTKTEVVKEEPIKPAAKKRGRPKKYDPALSMGLQNISLDATKSHKDAVEQLTKAQHTDKKIYLSTESALKAQQAERRKMMREIKKQRQEAAANLVAETKDKTKEIKQQASLIKQSAKTKTLETKELEKALNQQKIILHTAKLKNDEQRLKLTKSLDLQELAEKEYQATIAQMINQIKQQQIFVQEEAKKNAQLHDRQMNAIKERQKTQAMIFEAQQAQQQLQAAKNAAAAQELSQRKNFADANYIAEQSNAATQNEINNAWAKIKEQSAEIDYQTKAIDAYELHTDIQIEKLWLLNRQSEIEREVVALENQKVRDENLETLLNALRHEQLELNNLALEVSAQEENLSLDQQSAFIEARKRELENKQSQLQFETALIEKSSMLVNEKLERYQELANQSQMLDALTQKILTQENQLQLANLQPAQIEQSMQSLELNPQRSEEPETFDPAFENYAIENPTTPPPAEELNIADGGSVPPVTPTVSESAEPERQPKEVPDSKPAAKKEEKKKEKSEKKENKKEAIKHGTFLGLFAISFFLSGFPALAFMNIVAFAIAIIWGAVCVRETLAPDFKALKDGKKEMKENRLAKKKEKEYSKEISKVMTQQKTHLAEIDKNFTEKENELKARISNYPLEKSKLKDELKKVSQNKAIFEKEKKDIEAKLKDLERRHRTGEIVGNNYEFAKDTLTKELRAKEELINSSKQYTQKVRNEINVKLENLEAQENADINELKRIQAEHAARIDQQKTIIDDAKLAKARHKLEVAKGNADAQFPFEDFKLEDLPSSTPSIPQIQSVEFNDPSRSIGNKSREV